MRMTIFNQLNQLDIFLSTLDILYTGIIKDLYTTVLACGVFSYESGLGTKLITITADTFNVLNNYIFRDIVNVSNYYLITIIVPTFALILFRKWFWDGVKWVYLGAAFEVGSQAVDAGLKYVQGLRRWEFTGETEPTSSPTPANQSGSSTGTTTGSSTGTTSGSSTGTTTGSSTGTTTGT